MPLIDPNKNPLGITRRLEGETNPEYRRMLEEVRFHITVEAACDVEPALARLAPNPEYVLFDHSSSPVTISGVDNVRRYFYDVLVARIDPRLEWDITRCLVDGRTVVTEGKMKNAIRGTTLISMGFEQADPDTFYLQEAQHLVLWPFDEQLRLIGETVYYGYTSPLAESLNRPLTPDDIGSYTGPMYEIS